MAVNDINDVPNAARSTVMVPTEPDDNAIYRYGVGLLAALYERGAVELDERAQPRIRQASVPSLRSSFRDAIS